MSDQQNLLDHLEEIKAVPEEKIVYCDMPYKVFIDEAEALHTRASIDLPLLSPYNLTIDKLNRLLSLIGAMRTAQSNWESQKTDKQKAIETWEKEAPGMIEFRDDVIAHMEFAYRSRPDLLERLDEIKEGTSRADAVQDLASLSVLGNENPESLGDINFDMQWLQKSVDMADHMGSLLGDINGRMYFEDDRKLIRDKAYTLCKEVVDDVRSYGKFVFRKDVEKRKAYSSKYSRERLAAYRKAKAAEENGN
ncbi:MAG: hypothetical protein N4A59_08875 [Marinifilum sp.]|jgi:hypothetical protein|nr:hypothetical protein [Marinifilum sp.]